MWQLVDQVQAESHRMDPQPTSQEVIPTPHTGTMCGQRPGPGSLVCCGRRADLIVVARCLKVGTAAGALAATSGSAG